MRKALAVALGGVAAGVAMVAATGPGSAAPPTKPVTATDRVNAEKARFHPYESAARRIANGEHLTWGARRTEPGVSPGVAARAATAAAALRVQPSGQAAPANVRVNDPTTDTLLDQTTQSETAIAAAGRRVVVGYNDSQRFHPAGLTAAANLSGYAYSADGGATFTDGGVIPNAPGTENVGDPWLGSDRAGRFFYSTLVVGTDGSLGVGVARSTDGGTTFSAPVLVNPADVPYYQADKPALAVGRDPLRASQDNVYVAWDDLFICDTTSCFDGLPVTRSTDGGQTFHTTWAARYVLPDSVTTLDCSFGQYFGSQPLVDPKDGTLRVFSMKIVISDPTCGVDPATETITQVVTTSTDGGQSFGPETTVATLSGAPEGALDLGPGKVMRTASFLSVAQRGGTIAAVWPDHGAPGSPTGYNLRWATSDDGGSTWSTPVWLTNDALDWVQPSLVADDHGWHVTAYQRTSTSRLSVTTLTSEDGTEWTSSPLTTASFGGVPTVPQFDPVIAWGYMGDSIASTISGGHLIAAWGDTRDVVRNALWPQGRNDPDVFFARR